MQKLERALHRTVAWLLALALYLAAITIAYAALSGVLWPEASGVNVFTKGGLTLDVSNAMNGYIMARSEPGNKRLKLRVVKGEAVLTYDLNSEGDYECFPLQMGSGDYGIELYRNVDGNRYSQEGSISFTVQLDDVNYSESSEAVRISNEICAGLSTDREKVDAVRNYVVSNFTYDYDKAATIKSGTLPSIDYLLQNRKGICQDIAAFTACALRVQGIPTQFVVGYANNNYHAWNNVLIDGQFQRIDLTAEVNAYYQDVTYTTERIY